jgi:hypothetical protein
MFKKTAHIVSFLLHPFLMPVAGMAILLFTGSYMPFLPLAARKMIIILFATGTLLLPAVMMPLTLMRRDLLLQKKDDRTYPLVLTFIFYLLTYFLFARIPVYGFMHAFMLGAVISVFLALMINLKWKISLHMIGLGGLSAFLLMITMTQKINLLPWFIISVFASGIAGTARLYLNSHSPSQVYTGFFAGFLSMTFSLSYLAF